MPLPIIDPTHFAPSRAKAIYPFHNCCPVCQQSFYVGDTVINSSYPIRVQNKKKPANVHFKCAQDYDVDKLVSMIYAPDKSTIL